MRDSQEYTEEALAKIVTTESLVGVFVSQQGAVATVDVAGVRLEVKSTTTVPVLPSDSVRLERRGSSLVMTGPTSPRAVTGRVTVAGNPATVEYPDGSGVTATLPVATGLTVDVDAIVFLDWASGGLVVAVIEAPVQPEPPDPPPGEDAGPKVVTREFDAVDSGSFQSGYGWRTNDVWSSASNIGAWFYGTQVKDTIPDGAKIRKAWIYLPRPIRLLGARPFGRHTAEKKPGGSLSITDTSTLGKTSGLVEIPTSLVDFLKANDGGLGFALGGYNIWPGTQKDGRSGQLRVEYET